MVLRKASVPPIGFRWCQLLCVSRPALDGSSDTGIHESLLKISLPVVSAVFAFALLFLLLALQGF